MKTTQIRSGNFVDFETIPYVVDTVTADGKLVVTAVHHDWKPEPAGIAELKGLPIDDEWLRENGFVKRNDFPYTFAKRLDDGREIVYDTMVHMLYFDDTYTEKAVPWPVMYVHQVQNACEDMEWEIEFKC